MCFGIASSLRAEGFATAVGRGWLPGPATLLAPCRRRRRWAGQGLRPQSPERRGFPAHRPCLLGLSPFGLLETRGQQSHKPTPLHPLSPRQARKATAPLPATRQEQATAGPDPGATTGREIRKAQRHQRLRSPAYGCSATGCTSSRSRSDAEETSLGPRTPPSRPPRRRATSLRRARRSFHHGETPAVEHA